MTPPEEFRLEVQRMREKRADASRAMAVIAVIVVGALGFWVYVIAHFVIKHW